MSAIGHIEIPVLDFRKAKKFYGNIFGWTFRDIPDMDYVLWYAAERPHGGLLKVKKMPKKSVVNVYIMVDDIDATLKLVKKSRGKVLTTKMQVGSMGWMAQFAAPDGCVLYLWQANQAAPQPGA